MKRVLIILFILLITIFVFLFIDYKTLGSFYFYTLFSFLLINIIINKTISLIDVWNFAFIFIVLSEVFSSLIVVTENHLDGLKYLITANNLINVGYFSKRKVNINLSIKREVFANKRYTLYLIIFLICFYFLSEIPRAVYIFSVGRNIAYSEAEEENLLGPLINALGFILPAISTYYFSIVKGKSLWISFLFSTPIFIVLFLGGTRFPLLFSFIGFLFVAQSKIESKFSLKKGALVVLSLVSLLLVTQLMKHFRSSTQKDKEFVLVTSDYENVSVAEYLSSYMSAEGTIDMTSLMFKHFKSNNHLYGKSTLFITYFWIPRQVWPDKPTMIGYWFIRKYRSNFGDSYSASFGFTGDLYADFGLFSLFFVFLIGRAIKYAENFKNCALKSKNYSIILGAMIFPYIFFFVRSPITATMNFLAILFFFYFFKRIIFSK